VPGQCHVAPACRKERKGKTGLFAQARPGHSEEKESLTRVALLGTTRRAARSTEILSSAFRRGQLAAAEQGRLLLVAHVLLLRQSASRSRSVSRSWSRSRSWKWQEVWWATAGLMARRPQQRILLQHGRARTRKPHLIHARTASSSPRLTWSDHRCRHLIFQHGRRVLGAEQGRYPGAAWF
jgi:hypothetical protein